MDGWDDRYLAQCRFGFKKIFLENGEGCRTEYSEGTAMAREKPEYLEGTAKELGDGHVRLTVVCFGK
jgi:hypothetical protein